MLVDAIKGRTLREILGSPDGLKFRSRITLARCHPKFTVSRRRVEIGDGSCWSGRGRSAVSLSWSVSVLVEGAFNHDQVGCCAFKQPRTFAQLLNWRMLAIWFETIYCLDTGDRLI